MTDIRPATPQYVPAIHAIYSPIVRETHISFEIDPPSEEEIRRRMEAAPIPWLVGVGRRDRRFRERGAVP